MSHTCTLVHVYKNMKKKKKKKENKSVSILIYFYLLMSLVAGFEVLQPNQHY